MTVIKTELLYKQYKWLVALFCTKHCYFLSFLSFSVNMLDCVDLLSGGIKGLLYLRLLKVFISYIFLSLPFKCAFPTLHFLSPQKTQLIEDIKTNYCEKGKIITQILSPANPLN